MPKTFYTERDIEDLIARGVTSLAVNDEIVVTDQAREKAMKLGFELIREHDQPQDAPIRPYITKQVSPSAAVTQKPILTQNKIELEQRVQKAVMTRLGDSVDPKLLETIIRRVLNSIEVK